jgi:hypothetical protein
MRAPFYSQAPGVGKRTAGGGSSKQVVGRDAVTSVRSEHLSFSIRQRSAASAAARPFPDCVGKASV